MRPEGPHEVTDRWADAAVWAGEGLRREVFYFGAPGPALYGSLYSAQSLSRGCGVVVCASWGFEADRAERLAHGLALTMARLGGAGLVFHYPGYGDSHGKLADATMGSLAAAAEAAVEEASRRRPQTEWMLAGLMIGAAVACLAQARSSTSDRLLLVQPALSPSAYFGELVRRSRRVTLGPGRIENTAFGYPLPQAIVDAGPEADADVRDALHGFHGAGTVLRYDRPEPEALVPERFEDLAVEGRWRFGAKDYPELDRAVADWLDANARARLGAR